jgi:hypothetical protein
MAKSSIRAVTAGLALTAWGCMAFGPGPSIAPAAEVCENQQFRTGPSANLPDCRAYELVSPAETNGRLLTTLDTGGLPPVRFVLPSELASPKQASVVFLAYQSALPMLRGATGVADTFEAQRGGSGWETRRRLSPSGSLVAAAVPGGTSPDHRYSVNQVTGIFAGSPFSLRGVYLGKPDGSFEPVGTGSLGSEPFAQARYLGERGEHIVFSTGHDPLQSDACSGNSECQVLQLEPDAPPTGTAAVYDREAEGKTQVVSLLPGDVPQKASEGAFYKGTSKDGSATAFEIAGTLYVRLDNQETKEVAAGAPIFAGLSEHGDFLFYVVPAGAGEAGTIHRFDTATETDLEIDPGDEGQIVNVSGDGSHVYFISKAQLDGSKGAAGQPNLYVWSGGSPEYVTTVAPSDLDHTSGTGSGVPALANWTGWVTNSTKSTPGPGPGADSSRTTPDGEVLVFESRAQLTSYENKGHTEIYRFADGDSAPTCVSCGSSPQPATGDARLQELSFTGNWTIIHNVSDDGSRVFFETDESLLSSDADGVNDIYEWHEAENGGSSLSLISSGHSVHYLGELGGPRPNLLLSITPDGSDVVFLSQDELAPGAPEGGASVIYDARVGGGFPASTETPPCLEESCRSATAGPLPSFVPSSSESLRSGGNVKPRKHKHRCRRSKHKTHKGCAKSRSRAKASQAEGPLATQLPGGAGSTRSGGPTTPTGSAGAGPVSASAPNSLGYGFEEVSAEESTTAAAVHPDFTTNIVFNHIIKPGGEPNAQARTEEVAVSVPPGLLGNPSNVPRCKTGELAALDCPVKSQVGIAKILATFLSGELTEPVYNLQLPHPDREIARLGFTGGLFPVFVDIGVRTAGDYGATATVYGSSGFVSLVSAKTTLWGDPADPVHDKQRLTPVEAADGCETACTAEHEERESGLPPTATFLSNPSACQPMDVGVAARSYQLPGQVFEANAPMQPITDCTGLPFAPSFEAEPTSHAAGAPTGLRTKLVLPQHEGPEERGTATMREARVTLPAGIQLAAGAANWIGTCSDAQVGYGEEVDTACPDSSKLGTATIRSPDLSEPIEGTIYQHSPEPGHQLGLWLTSDALGLHIKLPGELEPDKNTGRLTAVFRDLPQVPVEEIDLNVWGGPRAPLQNPDHCGTFTTDFFFSPHSNDPAVSGQSTMQITEGCNQGFSPTLHAGVTEPTAGKFSPFVFDLNRDDGTQALRGFSLKLPDGELATLKGVPLCSDADATNASCPPGSRIGSLQATTGPGPEPLSVPQPGRAQPQIYLAGPYEGSPFSIVSEVPAQAGPFDLGVLAVRSGLTVEPETGQAIVKADPLPQFFEGIGIAYRHLHALIDRSEFSLNPTDCREMAVTSDVTSTQGTVAHPQARFQVDGCKRLKFKPKLSLNLRGGTKRAGYPALTAVLRARRGDANIASASVVLPHSEFLAQEHIATICTRKLFAADKCPKGSVYGRAKAITPLLDKPLSGPVYLRSSDHPLPDLVAKLGGRLEIDLVGRIDSVHGGIRATFESVPDAPVSKFILQMKGGRKSLLTNSTDICRGAHEAMVALKAQNGRVAQLRPVLQSSGCGKKHH